MTTAQLKNIKQQQGFTLIELLVVIGILAILLAITLIAINPARQFGNANNTKRQSDVTQVLNAIGSYSAENKGQLPPEVAALAVDTPTEVSSVTTLAPLCTELVPNFIPALPTNPTLNKGDVVLATCTANPAVAWATGYTVSRDATNRITVSVVAGDVDNGATISVTR